MTAKLSEKVVTKQIVDFMRAHRWRAIRLQSGLFSRPLSHSRVRIGEAGMPDWVFIRPFHVCTGTFEVLFAEIKGTYGQQTLEQLQWAKNASDDGFDVICVSKFESFETYYAKHYVD